MGLDLRALFELFRIVLVMRQLMMRIRDAELGYALRSRFAVEHERDHPCQIALVRQHLQVIKERHVLVKRVGNADRPIHFGQLQRTLFLCLLIRCSTSRKDSR